MENEAIIRDFYKSFSELDAGGMTAHYSDDIFFVDPAFGELKGERAKNMWRMLVESQKGKDFIVVLIDIKSEGETIIANWKARYEFSKTKRKVHNKITARIKIENGLITEHRDDFNLHRWATQALGLKGWLIGWTPYFRQQLQRQTNKMLNKFEKL